MSPRRWRIADAAWGDWANAMSSREEQIRAALTEEASEWFVANDEESLGAPESETFVAWLQASPLHVEEFLGVAVVARDLRSAAASAEHSIDALVAAAHADADSPTGPFWRRPLAAALELAAARWQIGAPATAALAVLAVAL